MSKPKRTDECHSFNIHVALIVGDRKAVLLKEIYNWCHQNQINNRNIYFGLAWTYNSAKAYKEKFLYWPEKSIARWLKELQADGWIYATDKFNKFSMDRTRWYTINFERYDLATNGQISPISQNEKWTRQIDICISQNDTPISQNEISEYPKMRNDISQNETTIPSNTISYSSTTTSKDNFAEKSAPLPKPNKTKFEKLSILADKINEPTPVAAAPSQIPECDEELTPVFAFEDFWNTYDMKTDRAKCEAKWKKLKASEIAAIEKTLPWYVADTVRDDSEQKPGMWRRRRKGPHAYLNGRTWQDYADATGPMVKPSNIKNIKNGKRDPNEPLTSWEQRERVVRALIAEDCQ